MLHSALSYRAFRRNRRAATTVGRCANCILGSVAWVVLVPLLGACTGSSLSLLPTELGTPASDIKPASAASLAPTASQAGTSQASGVLAEARGLRRAGEKKKAFELIEGAVAKAPAAEQGLLVEGGLLALEIGAPEKAELFLKKAQDPAKPDWRILSGLGVAASAQGRHEEARRHFNAALALSPGQPAVLNNLALSHVLERKPGEAEKVLREASKAAPKSARIKQNLALTQGLKARGDEPGETAAPASKPAKAAMTETPAVAAPRKAAEATGAQPSWQPPQHKKVAQSHVAPESSQLGIGASIGD